MNTLQKIADLEIKIATLEAKQSVFEKLALSVPKLEQDLGRLTGDAQKLADAIREVAGTVGKRTADLSQMDNMIITRLMGLEQAFASLSKTIAATVAELSSTKVLNEESVITRIRKSDEAADEARVKSLLEQKVLKESSEISQDSLIVVAQDFTYKSDGKVDIVAEYRTIELASPNIDEETRKNYIGKKNGDVVELNLEDGVLKTTVLQVYDYVQVYAQSEQADAQSEKSNKPEASNQQ